MLDLDCAIVPRGMLTSCKEGELYYVGRQFNHFWDNDFVS